MTSFNFLLPCLSVSGLNPFPSGNAHMRWANGDNDFKMRNAF